MSSRKRKQSDSGSLVPGKSQRLVKSSPELRRVKTESVSHRRSASQPKSGVSLSFDGATPRTLVENFLTTHTTAETTRKLPRVSSSPCRRSPRRRLSRIDSTLRKKAVIHNVLKDANDGPTPRSLIQAVIAQAPPETPVEGTHITARNVHQMTPTDNFVSEDTHVLSGGDQTPSYSFLEANRYPLHDRARMLKDKKLEHLAAAPAKVKSVNESAHESLAQLSPVRRSPRWNKDSSPSTPSKKKTTVLRLSKGSAEDPTPRSLIQAMVTHAPPETPIVGTELGEKTAQRMTAPESLILDSTQVMSDVDQLEDSLLQLYRSEHHKRRADVNIAKFATDVKERIDQEAARDDGIYEEEEDKDKHTSEIHEPVDKLQSPSVDVVTKAVDGLLADVVNEIQSGNSSTVCFTSEIKEILQSEAQSVSRETMEQADDQQNMDSVSDEPPSESESVETSQHSTEKMFTDNEDSEHNDHVDYDELGDESEMQEELIMPVLFPNGMKQLKITELLNSAALQNVDSELANMQASFAELVQADFLPTGNRQAEKPPQVLKIRNRAPKSMKPKGEAPPKRLPRSLTKSIAQHFTRNQRMSREVLDEVEKVADKFWKNVASDLSAYAQHAKRKSNNECDVELLMKRQGFVTPEQSMYSLVEEYLPLEYRQEIIPIARSGNVIEPKR
ncbi:hypothetical protein LSH36_506g02070 [Paralvinella palmiformis]|uniref:CENP-T/Histone H4 histone fold domain-containing protein n=1 Tax=Paralvinella palmiformis TaxID=53620 RepID=A0AAD9J887_9ANNE|nr:hypothetical protein LSH36_506g02070 [Paralvinella palmiformis]